MYFSLTNDFGLYAKEELGRQLQLYKQALENDEPFSVLKSIQQNIRYLQELVREEQRFGSGKSNGEAIL